MVVSSLNKRIHSNSCAFICQNQKHGTFLYNLYKPAACQHLFFGNNQSKVSIQPSLQEQSPRIDLVRKIKKKTNTHQTANLIIYRIDAAPEHLTQPRVNKARNGNTLKS